MGVWGVMIAMFPVTAPRVLTSHGAAEDTPEVHIPLRLSLVPLRMFFPGISWRDVAVMASLRCAHLGLQSSACCLAVLRNGVWLAVWDTVAQRTRGGRANFNSQDVDEHLVCHRTVQATTLSELMIRVPTFMHDLLNGDDQPQADEFSTTFFARQTGLGYENEAWDTCTRFITSDLKIPDYSVLDLLFLQKRRIACSAKVLAAAALCGVTREDILTWDPKSVTPKVLNSTSTYL
jgi:hypothetical protein